MGEVFRFKHFSVSNSRAGLKVGTDAVLLGTATTLTAGISRVLDIGTGTGVIALILAQRLSGAERQNVSITGIDIDEDAACEAAENFSASPWPYSLIARHTSLQDFDPDGLFDLIVSNPPYYDESLKAPDPQRSTARHTESLSYREVITFAGDFLAPGGRLALVLPKEEEVRLLRFAASFGLKTVRMLNIRTTSKKAPKRIIAEFMRAEAVGSSHCHPEYLTIQEGGDYTPEYRSLTGDFYLWG